MSKTIFNLLRLLAFLPRGRKCQSNRFKNCQCKVIEKCPDAGEYKDAGSSTVFHWKVTWVPYALATKWVLGQNFSVSFFFLLDKPISLQMPILYQDPTWAFLKYCVNFQEQQWCKDCYNTKNSESQIIFLEKINRATRKCWALYSPHDRSGHDLSRIAKMIIHFQHNNLCYFAKWEVRDTLGQFHLGVERVVECRKI
jgi:hypothetical protein